MKLYIKILPIIMALLLPVNNSVLGGSISAEDTVKETTHEILVRLQAERDMLTLHPEYIEEIVHELIVPHFDFKTMSSLVLGKHWQEINEADKTCFSSGFRDLLVGRYANIFLSYSDQKITYEPEKTIGEKDYVSVRQIVSHDGIGPFYVDYPMRPDKEGWKVVDIIVDEVSLLKSYRLTFKHYIHEEGLKNFIDSFQECMK